MKYREAQAVMKEIQKRGSIYGLDCMNQLLNQLGNPQLKLTFLHVAGTNGKGSLIACLSSILKQAGYRVGRYTSPAVFSKLESFCIDEQQIQEEEYADLMEEVLQAGQKIARQAGQREPTAFELETALALVFFARHQCELVLLETGMGGDLDATNCIPSPLCTVFMPISRDHMQFLGQTIEEIAGHKAGIIKSQTVVVSARQENVVEAILRKQCQELQVPFYQAGKTTRLSILKPDLAAQRNEQEGSRRLYQSFSDEQGNAYEISLLGIHQVENAAVALKVIQVLQKKKYRIDQKAIVQGLRKTTWHGRFCCLHQNPDIYMDGAHNEAAAKVLAQAVQEYMPHRRRTMIAGIFSDKEYVKIASIMQPFADRVITVTPPTKRGLKAEQLLSCFQGETCAAVSADSVDDAVKMAFADLEKDDALLAFGSLSFLCEFEQCIKEQLKGKKDAAD